MRAFNTCKELVCLAVIVTLSVLILFSGCSKNKKKEPPPLPGQEWVDDMRKRADKAISDPGEKSAFMDLIDQEEKTLRELTQNAGKFFNALLAADRNYDSTPHDFKKIFADYNTMRKQLRDRSIEVRFNMQALVTEKEWEEITDFSKRKGLLDQVIQQPAQ
jgi:hypothetical protein